MLFHFLNLHAGKPATADKSRIGVPLREGIEDSFTTRIVWRIGLIKAIRGSFRTVPMLRLPIGHLGRHVLPKI